MQLGVTVLAGSMMLAVPFAAAAQTVPSYIQDAIANKARPKFDTDRDYRRAPAPQMIFSTIKPGDKVADIGPGSGYGTRLYAKMVGPKGHVYAVIAPADKEARPKAAASTEAEAKNPAYGNITISVQPFNTLKLAEALDVVMSTHDYHTWKYPGAHTDTASLNKAVFAALKPGGVFVITDFAGAAGTAASQAKSHDRIEGAFLRREVEAAGFVFDAESKASANTRDDRKRSSEDESLKGEADQFTYRFRKPKV